ncbi:MAG: DUF1641 domain-containing protein [Bacteroidales bacterium]|jgi:uncharacterized protein YjgD (DUF1641 family)|nr:DUF1641 domain-containing protein [Bacteroidales bacterium]
MDNSIQIQINELHQKMDVLLEYVNKQRLNSEVVEDLISDMSIIGKDVYDSTVEELENRKVEIHPEELTELGISFLRNIKNFNMMIGTFESMVDLSKEVGPIANEVIIDFQKKLGEFEEKGYFEFISATSKIFDNIITHFSKEDVQMLADNVVVILETVKGITQPEMLKSVDNALKVYSSLEMDNIPQYSIWRVMREMNKPEMKRALGFAVTFMKNMSAK